MTPITPKPPNPNGHNGASRKKIRPGTTTIVGGREIAVADNKPAPQPKKTDHIPGHPLDLDLRIDTGRRPPAGFVVEVIPASIGKFSLFSPAVDPHYGIFWQDEEELLHEMMENLAGDIDARNGVSVWQAPMRIIDCTPSNLFKSHNFKRKVITNSYYAHEPASEVEVLQHIQKAYKEIEERCLAVGVTAPPVRGYDLITMWLTPGQAERLAVEHNDLLIDIVDNAWKMHLPVIFVVEGQAAKADYFVKTLARAVFIGEQNKEYIYEAINTLMLNMTGKPVKVEDTSPNRYPLGYEPIWNANRERFVISSIYTRKGYGVSLKGFYQAQDKAHNQEVWNDFLSTITTGEY